MFECMEIIFSGKEKKGKRGEGRELINNGENI